LPNILPMPDTKKATVTICFGFFSALSGCCLCACQLKKLTIQPLLIKTTPEKAYLFSKCLLISLVSNNKRSSVLHFTSAENNKYVSLEKLFQ